MQTLELIKLESEQTPKTLREIIEEMAKRENAMIHHAKELAAKSRPANQ